MRKSFKANGDAIIIREAVAYAQAVGAYHGGFKADPDSDMENAARSGEKHSLKARAALARLASIPAGSAAALDSKARVLPLMLDDSTPGYLSEESEAFLRAFAADVRGFLEQAERQKNAA